MRAACHPATRSNNTSVHSDQTASATRFWGQNKRILESTLQRSNVSHDSDLRIACVSPRHEQVHTKGVEQLGTQTESNCQVQHLKAPGAGISAAARGTGYSVTFCSLGPDAMQKSSALIKVRGWAASESSLSCKSHFGS